REQPSLYPIAGGDAEGLMAKLTAARDRWAKTSGALPMITLCYEVGYDAFWLARFLKTRGIECLVIDPGSLQVSRRGRRVKTDRVDVKTLLRTLIAWCRYDSTARLNGRSRGLPWYRSSLPRSNASVTRHQQPARQPSASVISCRN